MLNAKQYRVDGYIPSVKGEPAVLIEYHECYFNGTTLIDEQTGKRKGTPKGLSHGICPACMKYVSFEQLTKKQTLLNKDYIKLRRKTDFKSAVLARDYEGSLIHSSWVRPQLVVIWSCQWQKMLRSDPEVISFVKRFRFPGPKIVRKKYYDEKDLVADIVAEKVEGFVQCSVSVPSRKRKYCQEFPPVFTHEVIRRDTLSPCMRQYAEKHDLMKSPTTLLVNRFHKRNGVFTTYYLRYLIVQFGAVVKNVQKICQFSFTKPFEKSIKEIVERRRQCDLVGDQVGSKSSKAILNSFIGYSITNMSSSNQYRLVGPKEYRKLVLQNNFVSAEPAGLTNDGESFFIVEMAQGNVHYSLPYSLGTCCLNIAKAKLLQFIYNFLKHYLKDSCFELAYFDTDSVCVCLAGETLRDCVKPHLLSEYDSRCYDVLVDERTPEAYHVTSREPGKWKVEAEGTGFVALASKSYIMINTKKPKDFKMGRKGVQDNTQNKQYFEFEVFRKVLMDEWKEEIPSKRRRMGDDFFLETDQSVKYNLLPNVINKGFRKNKSNIFTYECSKKGLNSLYPKAFVLPCKVHIEPYPESDFSDCE
jgi:hypothetical protein